MNLASSSRGNQSPPTTHRLRWCGIFLERITIEDETPIYAQTKFRWKYISALIENKDFDLSSAVFRVLVGERLFIYGEKQSSDFNAWFERAFARKNII